MPNLDFSVQRAHGYDDGLTAAAKIRGINEEFRGLIKGMIETSLAEGLRIAHERAPRGPFLEHNEGRRIVDQIFATPVRFSPGGAGGGGNWEGELRASNDDGGHLQFVFEGTAGGGVGKIFPNKARSGHHGFTLGGALAIQKEGEGVHFRSWVHGQKPQQEWWYEAEDAMERKLEEQIHTAAFIHGFE